MKLRKVIGLMLLLTASLSGLSSCSIAGPQGPQGEQGVQGEQGIQGEPGQDGQDGVDGTSMLTGYGIPSATLGKDGDSYIDLNTWDYYIKENGVWALKGNIKGEDYQRNTHTVTFDSKGGSEVITQKVLHGEKIVKPQNPTKAGSEFVCWEYMDEPWVFHGYVCTEDMTLTAVWDEIEYDVTFVNDDGSVLDYQSGLHYGDAVIYDRETPVKQNVEEHYVYTFAGWDKELIVTGDMTFTAQYDAEYAPFTAVFQNYDGTELYRTLVKEDEIAVYQGGTPTRPTVDNIQYAFREWIEISNTSDTIIYQAAYDGCTEGLEFEGGAVSYYTGTSKKVVIPSKWDGHYINTILNDAFSLIEIEEIVIPASITSYKTYAFRNCGTINKVYYAGTEENWCAIKFPYYYDIYTNYCYSSPMNYAEHFYMLDENDEWYEVKEITVPDRISTINPGLFSFRGLKSIKFGKNIKEVVCGSFSSNLENVYYTGNLEDWCNISFQTWFAAGSIEGCANPMGPAEHFYMLDENDEWYEVTEIIITGNVSKIPSCQFYGFDNVVSIKILGDCPISIGNKIDYNCTSLSYIYLSENVYEVANNAFTSHCATYIEHDFRPKTWDVNWSQSTITAVTWGWKDEMKITQDGMYTYILDENNLATIVAVNNKTLNVIIPVFVDGYKVTTIGSGAFTNCINLTDIVIPNNIISIGSYAFYNCSNLSNVVIPDSVKSIGDDAFFGCNGLKIYCDASSKPSDWSVDWNYYKNYNHYLPVYWAGEWEYDSNGNPTPII